MSIFLRRFTASLLLVGYILANTLVVAMHDHGHVADQAASGPHSDHGFAVGGKLDGTLDFDARGLALDLCGSARMQRSSAPTTLDDDACSTCRFLGQQPLPMPAAPLQLSCLLVAEVVFASPGRSVPAFLGSPHSRAPPQFA